MQRISGKKAAFLSEPGTRSSAQGAAIGGTNPNWIGFADEKKVSVPLESPDQRQL